MSKIEIMEMIDSLKLVEISKGYRIDDFESEYEEYTVFLKEDALDYQLKNISKTHLLINIKNGDIIAYIALLTGSIKLNSSEKDKHEVPSFGSYPSLKIGKLSVDKRYNEKYRGIGKLMIEFSIGFMKELNDLGVACRFLEVDADVENNASVVNFYEKCNFVKNEEYKKKSKTVSMRLDDISK